MDPEDVKLEGLINAAQDEIAGAKDPKIYVVNLIEDIFHPNMKKLIAQIDAYGDPGKSLIPFFQDHMNAASFLNSIGYTSFRPDEVARLFNVVTRMIIEDSIRSNNVELDNLIVPDMLSRELTTKTNQKLQTIEQDIYFNPEELTQYGYLRDKAFDFMDRQSGELDYDLLFDQGMKDLKVGQSHKEHIYLKYWLTQAFLHHEGIIHQDTIESMAQLKRTYKKQAEEYLEQLREEGGPVSATDKRDGALMIKNMHPTYNAGNYAGKFMQFRERKILAALKELGICKGEGAFPNMQDKSRDTQKFC